MLRPLSREEATAGLAGTDHVYPAPVDVDMLEGDWRAEVADPARKAFLCVPGAAEMARTELEDRTAGALARLLFTQDVRRAVVIGRGLKGEYEPLSPPDGSGCKGPGRLRAILDDELKLPPQFIGAVLIEGSPAEVAEVSAILAHGAWMGGGLSGLWTWLCPDAGLILRACHHRHLHSWPRDAKSQGLHEKGREALGLLRQPGCAPPQ